MSAANAPPAILRLGDANAYLLQKVGRGGRIHYAHASACLSVATGRTITVAQRPSGRPRLAGHEPELGVSLSYRDGFLLIGYSPAATVGVDIEPDDASLDAAQLAREHFSQPEAAIIAAQETPDRQRDLFLRLWVAKEAILKATGRGVYDGLDQPDLSAMLAELRADGRAFRFTASGRISSGAATVRTLAVDGAPTLYVALARLD